MKKYDIIIIDPASTEFNRGSFCYLPYLFYSGLKHKKHNVKIIENFTTANLDDLPDSTYYYVALWSYPQIEACRILRRFLPRHKTKFFGYYPLIDHLKLPKHIVAEQTIKRGILEMPNAWGDFKYLLLSDCDMHLAKYTGTVYPFFTSYGCPNKCTFCPSTINCHYKRAVPPIEDIIATLTMTIEQKITNIHFTDEDFFWNIKRAYEILSFLSNYDMQLIVLGEVKNVLRFINKYGTKIFESSGLKLIEVGFETGDDSLSKLMGKDKNNAYHELAERMSSLSTSIFWLTLSFFPGETITSLNKTGEFLKKYGWAPADLYSRIATNSTHGGLGQFFQPYHGTANYENLKNEGQFLTLRPVRLIPSFLPNSFMNDTVIIERNISVKDRKWFAIYGLKDVVPSLLFFNKKTVKYHMERWSKNYAMTQTEAAILLAICARLGIIGGLK